MISFTENTNPWWLEGELAQGRTGPCRGLPGQRRKDSLASSQSSNWLGPMVCGNGGGVGGCIYKKLQDSHPPECLPAHLLNFNEQSYDWAINPMSSTLYPRQPETQGREAVGSLVQGRPHLLLEGGRSFSFHTSISKKKEKHCLTCYLLLFGGHPVSFKCRCHFKHLEDKW